MGDEVLGDESDPRFCWARRYGEGVIDGVCKALHPVVDERLDFAIGRSYTLRKNTEIPMAVASKKLQRIGNSTGVILPADLLREAGLGPGDEVVIQAERGRVVITVLDPDFDDLVCAADRFVAAHPNALRKLAE